MFDIVKAKAFCDNAVLRILSYEELKDSFRMLHEKFLRNFRKIVSSPVYQSNQCTKRLTVFESPPNVICSIVLVRN